MGNIIESLYRLAEANNSSLDDVLEEIHKELETLHIQPYYREANCEDTSKLVVNKLKAKGIEGAKIFNVPRIEGFKENSNSDDFIIGGINEHTVVELGNKLIDYTNQQYDECPNYPEGLKECHPVIFEKEDKDTYTARCDDGYLKIKMR